MISLGTPAARPGAAARWRAAGLGAVLLSFLLRLYDLTGPSIRGDEAFTVTFARQDLPDMIQILQLTERHPPGYYAGMHFWMQLAGQSELAVRFSSVLAGVLLVALIFRLGVATTGLPGCGVLAAILAAVNSYLVWHAQDARMYSLYAAACTLMLLLAVRIWRRQAGGQLVGGALWAGYAVAALTALYVHYWAVLIFASLNAGWLAWLWLQTRRGRPPGRTAAIWWLLAQGFVAAVYVPWLVQAAPLLIRQAGAVAAPPALGEVLQRTAIALSLGQTAGEWAAPMAALFVAVAVLGVAVQAARSLPTTAAMLIYVVLPVAAAFGLSRFLPAYEERYALGVAGAYVLCLAWGLCGLQRWNRPPAARGVQMAVTLLLVGISCYSLYNYTFVAEYRKSPGWREASRFLISQALPGDVVIENVPDPALTYYLEGRLDLTVQPVAAPVDATRLDRDLRQLAAKYRRAWFMPDQNPAWDSEGAVQAWLNRNGELLSVTGPGGMVVMLYELARP